MWGLGDRPRHVGPREWELGRGPGQRALKSTSATLLCGGQSSEPGGANAPRASPDGALVNVLSTGGGDEH